MTKPESPISEKEIPHLGRAASDMGFSNVDEYMASLFKRMWQYAVECEKWIEQEAEKE